MSRISSIAGQWFRIEDDNGIFAWDGMIVLDGRSIAVTRWARIGPRGRWKMVWEAVLPIERGRVVGMKGRGPVDRLYVNELYSGIVNSGVRKNPSYRKVGKVRRNSVAVDYSKDLVEVENSRDGTSAVTLRHYGRSRQYFGLYEWIPDRGRGFDAAFTWHLDERAARADSDEVKMLTDAHARKLNKLAQRATVGL